VTLAEHEHAAARARQERGARVHLPEERLLEGGGVEPVRAEVARQPAEQLGAGEAAGARRALEEAHAPAGPREQQGSVEAGDAGADDEALGPRAVWAE
jgi:hypothetical protein